MYTDPMTLTDFIATVTRLAIALSNGDNVYVSGALLRPIHKAMKAERIRLTDAEFAALMYEWQKSESHKPQNEGVMFMAATGTKNGTHYWMKIDEAPWTAHFVGIRLRRPK